MAVNLCTQVTVRDPSPTANPTPLVEPARISLAARIRGTVVSRVHVLTVRQRPQAGLQGIDTCQDNRLDGCAGVVNSGRFKSICAFGFELSPMHSRCYQYGAGARERAAVQVQGVKVIGCGARLNSLDRYRRNHLRAEFKHLENTARCQFGARQPARKADEVFDLGRCPRLAPGSKHIEHDCGNALGCGINRRGHPCRAGADNRQIHSIGRTMTPDARALRQFAKPGIDQSPPIAEFDDRRLLG